MTHLTTYAIIATVAMAAIAALIVNVVKARISKTIHTFELRAKNGTKVTFTVGEGQDISEAVTAQLAKLKAK